MYSSVTLSISTVALPPLPSIYRTLHFAKLKLPNKQ